MANRQNQKSGDNSVNTQVGNNQYVVESGVIHVKEQNDQARIAFIVNAFKAVGGILLVIVAFVTNPSAEDHLKKITRGAFSNYRLDHEFFYDNYFLWSNIYVVGEKEQRILFSWGAFGKIIETSDYNFNQKRLNKPDQ